MGVINPNSPLHGMSGPRPIADTSAVAFKAICGAAEHVGAVLTHVDQRMKELSTARPPVTLSPQLVKAFDAAAAAHQQFTKVLQADPIYPSALAAGAKGYRRDATGQGELHCHMGPSCTQPTAARLGTDPIKEDPSFTSILGTERALAGALQGYKGDAVLKSGLELQSALQGLREAGGSYLGEQLLGKPDHPTH